MLDGKICEGEVKIDIYTESAIITSKESVKDFFFYYDGSNLKGIYCLDLERERMKRVKNLEQAVEFYEFDPHKCECGNEWDKNGVCKK